VSTTTRPSGASGRPSPSLKPALVIVLIALVIVVGGAALALVGTSSARPSASKGPANVVPGSKLRAQSAALLIAHIASAGEPPLDVIDSLAVPAGSSYLGKTDLDSGLDVFNRRVEISVNAPEAEVKTFYLKLLSEQKWVTNSITSPKTGSTEILAQRNGSDGYQWGVGLNLTGVGALVAPALAGSGGSAAKTTISMTIYQVEDAS
jgi:hypothetical protein